MWKGLLKGCYEAFFGEAGSLGGRGDPAAIKFVGLIDREGGRASLVGEGFQDPLFGGIVVGAQGFLHEFPLGSGYDSVAEGFRDERDGFVEEAG